MQQTKQLPLRIVMFDSNEDVAQYSIEFDEWLKVNKNWRLFKPLLEIDPRAEQETIKNCRERIRQAERAGEFALSETSWDFIVQEQDHEIDLKDALGLPW